jgi:pentatricopeptide repeat protein
MEFSTVSACMDYGVAAGVEHYGCLVDLLGRAGRLEEAYVIVKNMTVESNEVIWGALLGVSRVHVSNEINKLRSGHASTNDAEYIIHCQIFCPSRRGWSRQSASGGRWQAMGLRRLQGAVQLSLTFLETNCIADSSTLFKLHKQ